MCVQIREQPRSTTVVTSCPSTSLVVSDAENTSLMDSVQHTYKSLRRTVCVQRAVLATPAQKASYQDNLRVCLEISAKKSLKSGLIGQCTDHFCTHTRPYAYGRTGTYFMCFASSRPSQTRFPQSHFLFPILAPFCSGIKGKRSRLGPDDPDASASAP